MLADKNFWEGIIFRLYPDEAKGLLFWIIGSLLFTVVMLVNNKELKAGLKGTNGLWEAPEFCLYICFWLFPQMIMLDGCCGIRFSDFAWYTLWVLMMYGFTGRWGLEWIIRLKNSVTQTTSISSTQTEIKKDQQIIP